jgi:hypothetical protein
LLFLLSIYNIDESIGFVHGKSNFFVEDLDKLRLFVDKKVILSRIYSVDISIDTNTVDGHKDDVQITCLIF